MFVGYNTGMKIVVAVGSTNPTKIDPVREIFSHHFKDIEVTGVNVSSGVRDQPMSDDEMYTGALNRARGALSKIPGAQYGVGIEGGTHQYSFGWFEKSLVVIVDPKNHIGVGASGGLALPDRIVKKLENGETLEQAIDGYFGTHKIGQGIGMFGILTKGVVTRSGGVAHGVAFALARFLHEDLYSDPVLE